MGTRKTQLMQGDRYGLLKAAELAAKMIGDFERARLGAVEIRVEAIGDSHWDDIHVARGKSTEKWQVKRLTEPVKAKEIEALFLEACDARHGQKTSLHLGVASLVSVKLGNEVLYELKRLKEVCQAARAEGLDSVDFYDSIRAAKYKGVEKLIEACVRAKSEGEVFEGLKRFTVHELGDEESIRKSAAAHLQDIFENPEEVVRQLHWWFTERPDGMISTDVRVLYEQVIAKYGRRDAARPAWLHIARIPPSHQWESRGPVACDDAIETMWGPGAALRLFLAASPLQRCAATAALVRGVVHCNHQILVESAAADEWKNHAIELCGGTLGGADVLALGVRSTSATRVGFLDHPAWNTYSKTDLASRLSAEMDDRSWALYRKQVSDRLVEDDIEALLRDEMTDLWVQLCGVLQSQDARGRRSRHLISMMMTADERRRDMLDVSCRVGPQTIADMARSTIVGLAFSASMPPESNAASDSGDDTNNLRFGSCSAHLLALQFASSPQRKPFRLSDRPGELLASEVAVVVLGTIEASADDLNAIAAQASAPYGASSVAAHSFHSLGTPRPMITACPRLRHAMATGKDAVRIHVEAILERLKGEVMTDIQQVLDQGARLT